MLAPTLRIPLGLSPLDQQQQQEELECYPL
jgi:hypothetical protein